MMTRNTSGPRHHGRRWKYPVLPPEPGEPSQAALEHDPARFVVDNEIGWGLPHPTIAVIAALLAALWVFPSLIGRIARLFGRR
jgi:hypothetical protein